MYTMIKQGPLHRIYVTGSPPPPPRPLWNRSGCATCDAFSFGCTRDLVDVASNYAMGPVPGNLTFEFQNMHLELTKYC